MSPEIISPKPPSTPAQIDASRRNGAKSKGPTTIAGKQRSSQSAIRHGLTSTTHTLLMSEDPAEYKEVCDAFIDDLRPATKAELRLVEKLANLDWRLERLVMMETALFNMAGGVHAKQILSEYDRIDGIGFIADAWRKSLGADHCQALLLRYMSTQQNQFNGTLANFEKFEARRLARRFDPENQQTYQCPVFDSMDATTEPDVEIEPEPEPTLHPPEPKLVIPPNEPEPPTATVAPIDIRTRRQRPLPKETPRL